MAEVFRAVALGPENFQRTLVINGTRTCRKIAFVQMFIDEAKVSGLLSHPNLVQIFEFGKVDESFFIAMEHVHGRTLAATQKAISQQNRVMPVPAATEIARQLCMVSNAIRCGRPTDRCWASCIGTSRNLMLSFHGTVKIQNPFDHRSDIFSLGTVLHDASRTPPVPCRFGHSHQSHDPGDADPRRRCSTRRCRPRWIASCCARSLAMSRRGTRARPRWPSISSMRCWKSGCLRASTSRCSTSCFRTRR